MEPDAVNDTGDADTVLTHSSITETRESAWKSRKHNHVDLVGLFCRSHGPSGGWENYVFPCERDTDLNLTPHARRCYLDFTSCIQHDRTLRRGVYWSRPIAVTWKIGAQGTVLEPETLTEHDFCDNGGHNLGARKELLLRVSWMQCLSEQATLVDSR